jgi:hypothetical protein
LVNACSAVAAPVPPLVTGIIFNVATVPKPSFALASLIVVAPVPPLVTGTIFNVATVPKPSFALASLIVVAPVPPLAIGIISLLVITLSHSLLANH